MLDVMCKPQRCCWMVRISFGGKVWYGMEGCGCDRFCTCQVCKGRRSESGKHGIKRQSGHEIRGKQKEEQATQEGTHEVLLLWVHFNAAYPTTNAGQARCTSHKQQPPNQSVIHLTKYIVLTERCLQVPLV